MNIEYIIGRLLPGNSIDFVNTYHMLLCCMNFVFVHAPDSHRLISFQDPSIIASNAASIALLKEEEAVMQPVAAPGGKNNLPYLCTIFKANFDEVSEVQNRLFGPFVKMVIISFFLLSYSFYYHILLWIKML